MNKRLKKKIAKREGIRKRVRKTISGSGERPRLCVFKSIQHIYVQAIDDIQGNTLASASSLEEAGRGIVARKEKAKFVGSKVAERLLEKGVTAVVFDRSGYPYHGIVKLVADSAREKGLKL